MCENKGQDLGIVVYACNLEVEAGRSQVQGQPGLQVRHPKKKRKVQK
jgi:hypothetical protein